MSPLDSTCTAPPCYVGPHDARQLLAQAPARDDAELGVRVDELGVRRREQDVARQRNLEPGE
jgi:hypothetical protein